MENAELRDAAGSKKDGIASSLFFDQPLFLLQIYEDVSPVHARNTITWDEHPNEKFRAASIHPCRHGDVMKKLGDTMTAGGKEFTVDQYVS